MGAAGSVSLLQETAVNSWSLLNSTHDGEAECSIDDTENCFENSLTVKSGNLCFLIALNHHLKCEPNRSWSSLDENAAMVSSFFDFVQQIPKNAAYLLESYQAIESRRSEWLLKHQNNAYVREVSHKMKYFACCDALDDEQSSVSRPTSLSYISMYELESPLMPSQIPSPSLFAAAKYANFQKNNAMMLELYCCLLFDDIYEEAFQALKTKAGSYEGTTDSTYIGRHHDLFTTLQNLKASCEPIFVQQLGSGSCRVIRVKRGEFTYTYTPKYSLTDISC